VGDVESLTLIDADGTVRTCSRRENSDLFGLAIGGYGMFGIIGHITLRLARRTKVRRAVEIIAVKDLVDWVGRRVGDGFSFGDCQYSIDLSTSALDHPGVFSCYQPISNEMSIPDNQRILSESDWADLYRTARTDKRLAFDRYCDYYRGTTGQVYWSDTHQLAGNFTGYRTAVDAALGTEMITEVYVSRDNFLPLMAASRQDFVDHQIDMSYGTIRFVEKDAETFLPWAREQCVCIVCNLHVRHTDEGKRKAAADFQRIIDRAIEFGGRYFLTYHRYARRDQVERCYPQFVDFLKLKKKHDPHERFQSDWYRHYKSMFADRL
jgi:FAD/FMN-containing dehydrogenase